MSSLRSTPCQLGLTLTFAIRLAAQAPQLEPPSLAAALQVELGAQAVRLCDVDLPAGLRSGRGAVRLALGAEVLDVELWPHSVRAAGFGVDVQLADGSLVALPAPPPARTLRGAVRSDPGSRVAGGLVDTPAGVGLSLAILRDGRPPLFVQPVARFAAGAGAGPRAHVAYESAPLPAGFCGVHGAAGHATGGGAVQSGSSTPGVFRVAELAFDADYDYYAFLGRSLQAVVDSIEQTLDVVDLMYEEEVEVTHRITRIVVRTAEPDPYSGNDAGTILGQQFRTEWNTNLASVPRDMAHFVTSRAMGNILGLAYVGVVCNQQSAYGLSRFGRGLGSDANVLGHELGHNWSLPHCLDTCDIMCGCGIAGGFGPNDTAQLLGYRDGLGCLDAYVPDLVGHFRFDETQGPVAHDAGPGGHDGTYAGCTLGTTGAAAATGSAVAFDGVVDQVTVLQMPRPSGAFTVTMWVEPGDTSGRRWLVDLLLGWRLGLVDGAPAVQPYNGAAVRLPGTVLPSGVWSHLAMRYDAAQRVDVFVDGVAAGTLALPAPLVPGVAWWTFGAADARFFHGRLDDLQIYDGAIDAARLASLFAHPGTRIDLPGWDTYGTGLAGTVGVPALGVRRLPLIGRSIVLDVGNSQTAPAAAVLLLGVVPASVPFLGGTLLVDLGSAAAVYMALPRDGLAVDVALPNDPTLSGQSFYLQSVLMDRGAPQGLAFSAGVRVAVGG
ncbi:MAG: hypothetical protein IPM29_00825 [Planctomycetes bacterium]|nr:hypothetical protein [Planctomycetota bacterium]